MRRTQALSDVDRASLVPPSKHALATHQRTEPRAVMMGTFHAGGARGGCIKVCYPQLSAQRVPSVHSLLSSAAPTSIKVNVMPHVIVLDTSRTDTWLDRVEQNLSLMVVLCLWTQNTITCRFFREKCIRIVSFGLLHAHTWFHCVQHVQ